MKNELYFILYQNKTQQQQPKKSFITLKGHDSLWNLIFFLISSHFLA